MKKKRLGEWLKSGAYLPPRLRDFHAQKDLFKTIEEMLARSPISDEVRDSWIGRHVYVIDYFLWFMARHGYTLQRSRQPVEFEDLNATIAERQERDMEMFRKMLGGRRTERQESPDVTR